jgi:hypothetical protein
MFGYEPHEHLLFAYEFFAKPECNRWKSLEKRKKRRVTWQTVWMPVQWWPEMSTIDRYRFQSVSRRIP